MLVTFLGIYRIIRYKVEFKTNNIEILVSIMINEQVQDQIKSIDNRLLHMWRYL